MAYEQKDFTGSLFKNDRKSQDSHPDYTGSCLIGGQEYWMNAWLKDIKNGPKAGQKFMSFSFRLKGDQPAKPVPESHHKPGSDDIPF